LPVGSASPSTPPSFTSPRFWTSSMRLGAPTPSPTRRGVVSLISDRQGLLGTASASLGTYRYGERADRDGCCLKRARALSSSPFIANELTAMMGVRAHRHPEANDSYELPPLGRMSWENSPANAYSGVKTVVMCLDDSTPGECTSISARSGASEKSANPGQTLILPKDTWLARRYSLNRWSHSIRRQISMALYPRGSFHQLIGAGQRGLGG
jgi:hypothetical protein